MQLHQPYNQQGIVQQRSIGCSVVIGTHPEPKTRAVWSLSGLLLQDRAGVIPAATLTQWSVLMARFTAPNLPGAPTSTGPACINRGTGA